MKKIDVEKAKKAIKKEIDRHKHENGKLLTDSAYFNRILSEAIDQLSDDKCEECNGLSQIMEIRFENGNKKSVLVDCPSCHGSGTKPDQVLEVLDKAKYQVSLMENFDPENVSETDGYFNAIEEFREILCELEQQRKEELGSERDNKT